MPLGSLECAYLCTRQRARKRLVGLLRNNPYAYDIEFFMRNPENPLIINPHRIPNQAPSRILLIIFRNALGSLRAAPPISRNSHFTAGMGYLC